MQRRCQASGPTTTGSCCKSLCHKRLEPFLGCANVAGLGVALCYVRRVSPREPKPRLKKKFGQHHLIRPEACRPLIEFLRPAGRRVVEIGPGGGVLTEALAASGASVYAFEVDIEWVGYLARRQLPGVVLALADALELDWSRLPPDSLVCGNLPYNVGTAILTSVLRHHARVQRAGFLLQLEVAQRLTAEPGSRAWGSLSVVAQLYSRPRMLSRVKPGAFRPPPRVESAFVGFELRTPPLADADLASFEALVRQGFAHKRKTLRNSLAQGWGRDRAEALVSLAGLSPQTRGEELALSDWLELFHCARQGGLALRSCES